MMTQDNGLQSFVADLQAMWSAEQMLTLAMPLMIQKATNLGLIKNLATHLAETDQHKVAIEAICKGLGFTHQGEENSEMKGLLEEGQKMMTEAASGEGVDAAIIAGAIKIEHYEIERYTSLGDTADALGYAGIARRLRLTLEEERQADAKLNFLDKSFIQKSAVLGGPNLALK